MGACDYHTKGCRDLCGKREFVRIRRFYLKLADGLGLGSLKLKMEEVSVETER